MTQSVMQKDWFAILRSRSHSKGSYDQNVTVCTISSGLLILLLSNFIW